MNKARWRTTRVQSTDTRGVWWRVEVNVMPSTISTSTKVYDDKKDSGKLFLQNDLWNNHKLLSFRIFFPPRCWNWFYENNFKGEGGFSPGRNGRAQCLESKMGPSHRETGFDVLTIKDQGLRTRLLNHVAFIAPDKKILLWISVCGSKWLGSKISLNSPRVTFGRLPERTKWNQFLEGGA